jgi:hypothetical protein
MTVARGVSQAYHLATQATTTAWRMCKQSASVCLSSRERFRRCRSLPRHGCWVPALARYLGARWDEVTDSQQPKPHLPTATQHDNRALPEPDGQANHGPRIAGHQQHRLVPAMQRSLRVKYLEPPQALPKPPLHAMVPPLRHAARRRVPGGHQCRAARAHTREQCLRRPTSDADVVTHSLVTRQSKGARQTRRKWLRLRCAPR